MTNAKYTAAAKYH